MITNLSDLQMLILLYAALNLSVRLLLHQPLVSAAMAFWLGWFFLIGSGVIVIEQDWRFFSIYSINYIETLFHGAFIGFLAGTFLGAVRKPKSYYHELVYISDYLLRTYANRVMGALFLLGSVFLIQRIATVGLSADYLSEVRSVYNQRQGGFLLRISSHLSVILTTLIIIRGISDSHSGLNIRMLGLVILAGAPLGLANGGRAFLLSYLIVYVASFVLSRSHAPGRTQVFSLPEVIRIGSLLGLLLTTFAVMGFSRGGYGESLNILYTILIWPVSTLYAMDSWVSAALTSQQTYGLLSFGWVADFAARIGLVDTSQVSGVIREVLFYFEDTNDSARVIPRSILPDLIFDFGEGTLLISMAFVAILLEFITSRYPVRGIFWHVLAVSCLTASFMTIQNSVISPGFAVTLFWAAVLSFVVRQNRPQIFK